MVKVKEIFNVQYYYKLHSLFVDVMMIFHHTLGISLHKL